MTQTVTVTQASIADLIEQRDALLKALKAVKEVDDFVPVLPRRVEAMVSAAIAKASPIVGLTEIGEEEVKNSTAPQSEPVLTPKSAIGVSIPRALRRTLRGCGSLPGYGEHPGSATLALFVLMGAAAGAHRGAVGAAVGAAAMLAVFGPMYLIGAHGRGRDYERSARRHNARDGASPQSNEPST